MDFAQAFTDGGPWMWLVLVLGLTQWSLAAAQMVKRTAVDLTAYLWGLIVTTTLLGLLGTVVGLHVGLNYVGTLPAEAIAPKLLRVAPIAMTTTILALLFAVPGSLAATVATARARKAGRG